MPYKKSKSASTPDIYKQKSITEYFKNIVPVVNRKLFVDDSARLKMPIYEGKFVGTNSDDEFCNLPATKIILPFPLNSDDEEVDTPIVTKNKKIKPSHRSQQSPSPRQLKSKTIPKNIENVTMIKLNKPSTSKSSSSIMDNFISPVKVAKESAFKGTSSCEESKNRQGEEGRSEKGEELQSKSVGGSLNQSIDKDYRNSTIVESNKIVNSKLPVITRSPSTPSKMNSSFDGSMMRGEKIRLTPTKTNGSAFKNKCREDISGTPSKRKKLDITLIESSPVKVKFDVGIKATGGSVEDSLASHEKTDCAKNMTKKISTPEKIKKDSVFSPSKHTPKRTPKKYKSHSPKLSPTKSRTNETPRTSKKKVTFGSGIKLKSEGEDETLNVTQLELLKKLFQEVLENMDKKDLLTQTDIDVVTEFLKMDVNNQYLLIKLFLYLPKWYNIVRFCSNIKLDQKLSLKEIMSMYEYHKNCRFVDTDITKLSINELLDLLMLGDLRQIAVDLKLPKKNHGTKAKLIDYLKQNCKTQTTLTMKKSSEDILKDAACKHLGYCVKLKDDIKTSFNKIYVLQTYSNFTYCIDVQNYLKDVGYNRVIYPSFTIENYNPFRNKDQFLKFYEAVGMHKELNHALENKLNVTVKDLCDVAFKKLQSIDDNGKWKSYLPNYLQKFSAEYRYISLLKCGIMKLTSKYFKDVKIWLEFLIKHYPTNHAIGLWYKQLAHINLQYYKNYENAAQIVIEAYEFNKRENIFNLLQTYELDKISNKLRNTKSYKLCALYCDRLADLSEVPVDTNKFVEKFIKGCTDRSGTPGKRIYSYRDSNNEVTYGSVENITLRYYWDNEEFEGIHCEGKLIAILFALLFWDIIYEYYVPRTFISELQSAPLDMYSDSFYEHRKAEINLRLEEIAKEWPEKKLEKVMEDNWKNHSHERSITDFEGLGKELDEILVMFRCIDRRVLSKIFSRLVINYRRYRSGLPDLFLWNAKLLKSKFVEVKGENDCLQPNQILWINHLIEVRAEVEVCHVSGVGAKKIITEDDD